MASRRSYRLISKMPAFWLLDEDKKIVASVRAHSAREAARIFRQHGLKGKYIGRPKS